MIDILLIEIMLVILGLVIRLGLVVVLLFSEFIES